MQLVLDFLFAMGAVCLAATLAVLILAPLYVKMLVALPIIGLALLVYVAQRTE